MNRFFIALYNQPEMVDFHMGMHRGVTHEDHSLNKTSPPLMVFYLSAAHRDRELAQYVTRWPGKLFVTGEITGGQQATVGPVEKFVVNEQGVLPA